jgi:Lactoylglutathione lyase and related lyases
LGVAPPASADAIPGLRGHDHTGITVPDVKAATAFFTDVIGCEHAMSFGPFSDDKGTFMQDVVNVNPRAVIDEISMVRCGYGSNIELFQYRAPDQAREIPRNSDIGGHHIALYVDDIEKAAAYLKAKGVRTLAGTDPDSTKARRPDNRSCISSRLGTADGVDQLSERHGLSEGRQVGAVDDDRAGEIIAVKRKHCSPSQGNPDWGVQVDERRRTA